MTAAERMGIEHLGPVIAVLRAPRPGAIAATVDALVEAGLRSIEITLSTPDALTELAAAVRRCGDDAVVGAGTVVTGEDAERAVEAGAEFLVTPVLSAEVLARRSLPVICGAFTPTEAQDAWSAGAAAVKLFPARIGGPAYVRDLLAPLPHLRLVATGGVGIDDAHRYREAGAVAVGLGNDLVGPAMLDGDVRETARRARRVLDRLR